MSAVQRGLGRSVGSKGGRARPSPSTAPWKISPAARFGENGDLVTDGFRDSDGELPETDSEQAEPPLLTKEEAIAEVRRWFKQHQIDPNQIFARAGDLIVLYKDLIPHLERETEEGRLLLRAISRGRVIRQRRESPGDLGADRK